MFSEPEVVHRAEQSYVAIRELITMQAWDVVADRIPQVLAWLDARGIAPAGAPFFRLNVIDMERELEVEAGVPIAAATEPDGEVLCAVLPAGRYVTLTSTGPADEQISAIAELFDWAAAEGLVWDRSDTDAGQRWGCRLQVLKTDPAVEPDMDKWKVENAFRLAE